MTSSDCTPRQAIAVILARAALRLIRQGAASEPRNPSSETSLTSATMPLDLPAESSVHADPVVHRASGLGKDKHDESET